MIEIQILQVTQAELQALIDIAVSKALEKSNSLQAKKQLITRKEFAKLRDVNYSTLWRWEQTGILIPKRFGSKIFYEV